jgi:hypothetical protein
VQSRASVIAAILSLLILFVFAAYLIPSVRRQYALPFNARYILPEVSRVWEIDEQGNGILSDRRVYLFFAEPTEDDLHDTPMGSRKLNLKDLKYESPDSVPKDYQPLDESMQRIYWTPQNGDIKIGVPYVHEVKSNFPYEGKELPKYKIMTLVTSTHTVKFNLSVKSRIPINEVVVFKERRFQKFKDSDGIARRGKNIGRTMAPLPRKIDNSNLTWTIENVPPQAIYYVILYFNYP